MSQTSQIKNYTLSTKIAQGGFCDIWLAQHHGAMAQKRWCVLKLLKEEFRRDDTSRKALTAEALLLAQMHHPNIIHLIEFGEDSPTQQLFCTLPYLQGKTLNTLVARGTKSAYYGPAEALWIAVEILDALAHVHDLTDQQGQQLNIVHRDVSPENVIVTFDGKIKLIDFGIALSELMTRQTQLRKVKGKAQYLSPEQARGERELDRRTDIYAAGLILYFLFSGHEAYPRDFMAALNMARNPKIKPLNQVVDLPHDVVHLVASMLQIDPTHRPSNARKLARHFRTLLQRYYPGYDRWSFADQTRAILKHDIQNERDFISGLSAGGTQIIKEEDLLEDTSPPNQLNESTTPLSSPHPKGRTHATIPDIQAASVIKQKKTEQILGDLENLYKK